MTKRSVDEWVGRTPDAKIPDRVIVRIFERQGGKCAITGVRLRPGHYQADHVIPLAAGGRHAESNIQLITGLAHQEKTRDDAKVIAKARRQQRRHVLPKAPSQFQRRPKPIAEPDAKIARIRAKQEKHHAAMDRKAGR